MNPLSTLSALPGKSNVAYLKRVPTKGRPAPATENEVLREHLLDIIAKRNLSALFQPIIRMQTGEIIGYEGLIRGPSDSPLHAPMNLFRVARANQLTLQVEHLCRRVVLERFAELDLPGKLFLNVSPECLLLRNARHGETLGYIAEIGINPERVIIELTENQPTYDYDLMREAVRHYRTMGFQIAIDDLGEGFSSLRLWSELRPEYVKIDMHFIQGINNDPVKLQFVRSIQCIAEQSESLVIAEGIETQAELLVLRDLGIGFGQGYHLGRPDAVPGRTVPEEALKALGSERMAADPHRNALVKKGVTILKLLHRIQPVSPAMSNDEVCQFFLDDPALQIIPVVDQGRPLGLISRLDMLGHFAHPYKHESYGKKSCTQFMDPKPLIADKNTSLQDLGMSMVEAEADHLTKGFIITDGSQYLGMGSGRDLMREIITQMQINAAEKS